jgi:hypothetical protein
MQARGENRHRDNTRIDATPKRGYEFEATSVKQHGAIAGRGVRRKSCGDTSGVQFQIFVSEDGFFGFAICKITKSDARSVLLCS